MLIEYRIFPLCYLIVEIVEQKDDSDLYQAFKKLLPHTQFDAFFCVNSYKTRRLLPFQIKKNKICHKHKKDCVP